MPGVPWLQVSRGRRRHTPVSGQQADGQHLEEAAARHANPASDSGQDEASINNRCSALGLPVWEAGGNWWGDRDMSILVLLETGMVIYRNVTFPSLPLHLCQRLRAQQILIYRCPKAWGNEPHGCPLPANAAGSSCSSWELTLLWNLESDWPCADASLCSQTGHMASLEVYQTLLIQHPAHSGKGNQPLDLSQMWILTPKEPSISQSMSES